MHIDVDDADEDATEAFEREQQQVSIHLHLSSHTPPLTLLHPYSNLGLTHRCSCHAKIRRSTRSEPRSARFAIKLA